MARFLLDTSVIVDVLNGKRGRAELLRSLLEAGHVLGCCPINVAEVYAGMRPQEEEPTKRLLESLEYHAISREAARLAGEWKRDHRKSGTTLHLADAVIAAVAITNRLTLMTDNVKDFPMKGLELYQLP
ncbi:MAG: type II toxin-antitoxin system VapC family toxin [Acidimicrobiia bacterium]|nr:type II toxin-antitoxin system VapC family toxin [Acidimicrobiia bacterium]